MAHTAARSRISALFDEFAEFPLEGGPNSPIGFPGYSESRGSGEAVVCGVGRIAGFHVVAAVFDFGFLGGSMGAAEGASLAKAMERAGVWEMPFVALVASGGARIQEGMAALAQMPRTVAAAAGLGSLRVSVLANPTTGGVYASFASLADLIVAEQGATIGFAGPRVVEAFTGSPLEAGSHTAERALERGLVDAVIPPADLRNWLHALLETSAPSQPEEPGPVSDQTSGAEMDPWDRYQIVRHRNRPAPSQYIGRMCTHVVELRGDRAGEDDPAIFCALARFRGRPLVVAALDRRSPRPSGFRKARRAIELAGRLRFPLVTLIDTPGADPSPASEYGGLAGEIARTFKDLLSVGVPVISIVTGEGGSGGALSLACGDRIMIQENAVFSVIAPEGAAAVLFRDPGRAPEAAALLKPSANDLLSLGLADTIIPEPPGGAHADLDAASGFLAGHLAKALAEVEGNPAHRTARFAL